MAHPSDRCHVSNDGPAEHRVRLMMMQVVAVTGVMTTMLAGICGASATETDERAEIAHPRFSQLSEFFSEPCALSAFPHHHASAAILNDVQDYISSIDQAGLHLLLLASCSKECSNPAANQPPGSPGTRQSLDSARSGPADPRMIMANPGQYRGNLLAYNMLIDCHVVPVTLAPRPLIGTTDSLYYVAAQIPFGENRRMPAVLLFSKEPRWSGSGDPQLPDHRWPGQHSPGQHSPGQDSPGQDSPSQDSSSQDSPAQLRRDPQPPGQRPLHDTRAKNSAASSGPDLTRYMRVTGVFYMVLRAETQARAGSAVNQVPTATSTGTPGTPKTPGTPGTLGRPHRHKSPATPKTPASPSWPLVLDYLVFIVHHVEPLPEPGGALLSPGSAQMGVSFWFSLLGCGILLVFWLGLRVRLRSRADSGRRGRWLRRDRATARQDNHPTDQEEG